MRARIETDRPGWLVFNEMSEPGWAARVDGARRPIHRANVLFQAVAIEPGAREAVFAYASRLTADQAAGLAASGMWLDYGFGVRQPDMFDRALAARAHALRGVKIRSAITLRPRAHTVADPTGERILGLNWHFSASDRRQHDAGRCNYLPLNLGDWPDLYRRHVERVDIAIIQACPKDADGFRNFSVAASESSGHRHFGGTGGQLGFVRAAHEKGGARKSRVVLDLPGGAIVTVPRTDVMYAATEYGVVCLKGKSVADRAMAVISIAHPDYREALERAAHAKGLIPRACFQ